MDVLHAKIEMCIEEGLKLQMTAEFLHGSNTGRRCLSSVGVFILSSGNKFL